MSRLLLTVETTVFFFNDTATTEIYTLSLHDALPISWRESPGPRADSRDPHCARESSLPAPPGWRSRRPGSDDSRSEEHTSELQSHLNLVCRLLLEKKKRINMICTLVK